MSDEPLRTRVVACPDGTTMTVEEFGTAGPDLATLVFLPALGVPVAYYRRLLTLWAQRGRHVVGVELRGLPDSSVTDLRRASYSYTHLVRTDLPAVLATLPSASSAVIVGHSLGGQIALLAASSGVAAPAAVVTIATGTSSSGSQNSLLRKVSRALTVRTVAAVTATLGYWPGHRLGFAGRQPRSLMRDWAHEARHGRYDLQDDPTDYEAALGTVGLPVLMVDLVGDSLVPARAVDHLADRLPAHVQRLTLPEDPSELLHHIRWARRHPKTVIDGVEKWLTGQAL